MISPVLFWVYIKDLFKGKESDGKQIADDAKLFRKVDSFGDSDTLQQDLSKLVQWSKNGYLNVISLNAQ